ncbi:hypothetical protein GX48_00295 [Paracoccidioides brasiliensis]|nr:hypothetical protein GX48_00295 [Paracoccidioides brasiliensis]
MRSFDSGPSLVRLHVDLANQRGAVGRRVGTQETLGQGYWNHSKPPNRSSVADQPVTALTQVGPIASQSKTCDDSKDPGPGSACLHCVTDCLGSFDPLSCAAGDCPRKTYGKTCCCPRSNRAKWREMEGNGGGGLNSLPTTFGTNHQHHSVDIAAFTTLTLTLTLTLIFPPRVLAGAGYP